MGRKKDINNYDNQFEEEDDIVLDDVEYDEEDEPDYEVDDYLIRNNLDDVPQEYWDE
jgi:hypothetical protein